MNSIEGSGAHQTRQCRNAADVFVTDLACNAHFAMKTSQRCAVAEQLVGKEFQRRRGLDPANLESVYGAMDFHAPHDSKLERRDPYGV